MGSAEPDSSPSSRPRAQLPSQGGWPGGTLLPRAPQDWSQACCLCFKARVEGWHGPVSPVAHQACPAPAPASGHLWPCCTHPPDSDHSPPSRGWWKPKVVVGAPRSGLVRALGRVEDPAGTGRIQDVWPGARLCCKPATCDAAPTRTLLSLPSKSCSSLREAAFSSPTGPAHDVLRTARASLDL